MPLISYVMYYVKRYTLRYRNIAYIYIYIDTNITELEEYIYMYTTYTHLKHAFGHIMIDTKQVGLYIRHTHIYTHTQGQARTLIKINIFSLSYYTTQKHSI